MGNTNKIAAMETIKQLSEKFEGRGEVRGYKFRLTCKTKRAICYEVSLNGRITHFEVFLRKINKRFSCESYPSSKAFGIWAWTFKSQELALNKLISITNNF